MDRFDALMSKIIFFLKKYHFNIFQHKNILKDNHNPSPNIFVSLLVACYLPIARADTCKFEGVSFMRVVRPLLLNFDDIIIALITNAKA